MREINLADDPRDAIPILMRRVHERAVLDFAEGRSEGYRTGRQLMELAGVTNWYRGQLRLASTIYNQTMWALSMLERSDT